MEDYLVQVIRKPQIVECWAGCSKFLVVVVVILGLWVAVQVMIDVVVEGVLVDAAWGI